MTKFFSIKGRFSKVISSVEWIRVIKKIKMNIKSFIFVVLLAALTVNADPGKPGEIGKTNSHVNGLTSYINFVIK